MIAPYRRPAFIALTLTLLLGMAMPARAEIGCGDPAATGTLLFLGRVLDPTA